MHEIFLCANVQAQDFKFAGSVLQGLSSGTAQHAIHRVVFFTGPSKAKGFNTKITPSAGIRAEWQPVYADLHKATLTQAFVVRARYDVSNKAANFGPEAPSVNLDTVPGTLNWCDLPDHPGAGQAALQRKMIDIAEQPNLIRLLGANNYIYKNEGLEETYTYYRDTIEFCFSRWRTVPTSTTGTPHDHFPIPFAQFPLADSSKGWQLFVRAYVEETEAEGIKKVHENIKRAHEELAKIQEQLEGVFQFRRWDRRCFDTRLARESNMMLAQLPQVQTTNS